MVAWCEHASAEGILGGVERKVSQLLLTIEAGSDPITGSLGSPDEEPRSFRGWIELAEAIEHARSARVVVTPHGERPAPRL